MPNVVLVTIDSLRADHVGAFGYHRNTTPFIDTLVERGIAFDAFANSNWTRASFPSIITSTYPLEHGGFEFLSENRTTIGTAMSSAGFETAGIHSNVWLSAEYGYDRGFDYFYDSKSDPTLLSRLRTYLKQNLNHDGLVYRTLQYLYDRTEEQAGLDIGQTYKDAETVTDKAVQWLSGVEKDAFVWVHYMDAHHPYVPHEQTYDDLDLGPPPTDREAIKLRRKMLEESEGVTDDELKELLALYDNEIRYCDRHVQRLYNAVKREFGIDDTAFVITSDHGEEFLDHGAFSHNPSMYDEVLHVPLVVEGADRLGLTHEKGKQDVLVELLDVAPTVCALGGVDSPETYRGRSVFERMDANEDASIISETNKGADYKLSLRAEGWKYIWDRDEEVTELYNLTTDPDERTNLVHEQRQSAQEARETLTEHLSRVSETNESLPRVQMDTETERRLKDLGYLE